MTDSAISGPIPSPGNMVAVIGVVDEQKALATEVAAHELDRLPIRRFAKVAAAMVISSRHQRDAATKLFEAEIFCKTANIPSSVKTLRSIYSLLRD